MLKLSVVRCAINPLKKKNKSKMLSSARQIKEGLYSITWYIKRRSSSEFTSRNDTDVSVISKGKICVRNLPENIKSCRLAYKLVDNARQEVILQMKFVFSEKVLLLSPSELDAAVILATHNGIQQKMDLSQSKWTTCFKLESEYRFYDERMNFDILVDFNPDCSIFKKGTQNVLKSLSNLWENKTLTDVTFKCQGVNIPAHANILACSSPVLAAMFLNDFKEKTERVVKIPDIKPNVFKFLLGYLYTGEAFLEGKHPADEDIDDLFFAADKYAIELLKEECAVRLSKNLTVENVARYFVLAHLYNSPTLHKSTLNFIGKHANKTTLCLQKAHWLEMKEHFPELFLQVIVCLEVVEKNRTDKLKDVVKKEKTRYCTGVWDISLIN